jgi:hypothetical protein
MGTFLTLSQTASLFHNIFSGKRNLWFFSLYQQAKRLVRQTAMLVMAIIAYRSFFLYFACHVRSKKSLS